MDIGIPSKAVSDPRGEFMGKEWNLIIKRLHVAQEKIETKSQWKISIKTYPKCQGNVY